MIRFNKNNDDKQYISIRVMDNKAAPEVYNYLTGIHTSINNLPCLIDNEEIAIELCGNSSVGFSLNDLRQQLKPIFDVVINLICVDLSVDGQRVY